MRSLISDASAILIMADLTGGAAAFSAVPQWNDIIRRSLLEARVFLVGTKHDAFSALPFDDKVRSFIILSLSRYSLCLCLFLLLLFIRGDK